MIKASDIPKLTVPKLNVEALLKEIERDAINRRLEPDGKYYDTVLDVPAFKEVKRTLESHGYDVLSDLSGCRGGVPNVAILVSLKRV